MGRACLALVALALLVGYFSVVVQGYVSTQANNPHRVGDIIQFGGYSKGAGGYISVLKNNAGECRKGRV